MIACCTNFHFTNAVESLVFIVLYINFFLLTSFSLPFSGLSLVGLALDVVD